MASIIKKQKTQIAFLVERLKRQAKLIADFEGCDLLSETFSNENQKRLLAHYKQVAEKNQRQLDLNSETINSMQLEKIELIKRLNET
jgi:hypothetical protein